MVSSEIELLFFWSGVRICSLYKVVVAREAWIGAKSESVVVLRQEKQFFHRVRHGDDNWWADSASSGRYWGGHLVHSQRMDRKSHWGKISFSPGTSQGHRGWGIGKEHTQMRWSLYSCFLCSCLSQCKEPRSAATPRAPGLLTTVTITGVGPTVLTSVGPVVPVMAQRWKHSLQGLRVSMGQGSLGGTWEGAGTAMGSAGMTSQ